MSGYCLNDFGFILCQGEDPDAENLWDRIPADGPEGSPAGEAIRAASRIAYRYYNDGDYINCGYGKETCNPAAGFLYYNTDDAVADIIAHLCAEPYPYITDSEYEESLYDLAWAVRDFITSDSSLWNDEGLEMYDYDIPTEYQFEDEDEDEDDDWW